MEYGTLTKILSMAVSRDRWIDQVHYKLSGLFREFCKQELANAIGYTKHSWEVETDKLAKSLLPHLKGEKKTKTKFDLKKAFAEAVDDSLGDNKLYEAKQILLVDHPLTKPLKLKLEKTVLDEKQLYKKMLLKHFKEPLIELGYKI